MNARAFSYTFTRQNRKTVKVPPPLSTAASLKKNAKNACLCPPLSPLHHRRCSWACSGRVRRTDCRHVCRRYSRDVCRRCGKTSVGDAVELSIALLQESQVLDKGTCKGFMHAYHANKNRDKSNANKGIRIIKKGTMISRYPTPPGLRM